MIAAPYSGDDLIFFLTASCRLLQESDMGEVYAKDKGQGQGPAPRQEVRL